MFTNLLFLIIALLLVNIAPEAAPIDWGNSPGEAFLLGLLSYLLTLSLITLQNFIQSKIKFAKSSTLLKIANLELLIFLSVYYFVLGSYKLFEKIPFFKGSDTPASLFSLGLFLGGIAIFHWSARYFETASSQDKAQSRPWSTAAIEIRMLAPFMIPFILFSVLLDLLRLYPSESLQHYLEGGQASPVSTVLLLAISLLFIFAMLVFLPVIIQRIWQCRPLEPGPLEQRLQRVCGKAHFKHAGMKTWTILNRSLTAAIIGIVPKFRYVIFTKRLLQEMEPEWVEAVLAHEIGHSHRKHLLLYPFIIFGMILCLEIYSLLFSQAIYDFFDIQSLLHPSEVWTIFYPFAIFIPYSLIIALYFRYIFGFFSRQFERQADLHVFNLGMDPVHMIAALNYIGIATGNTHRHPSWHHYSIQQRMDFLEAAAHNPNLVKRHHNKVFFYLLVYSVINLAMLWTLLAALFPSEPLFHQTNAITTSISKAISHALNGLFTQ